MTQIITVIYEFLFTFLWSHYPIQGIFAITLDVSRSLCIKILYQLHSDNRHPWGLLLLIALASHMVLYKPKMEVIYGGSQVWTVERMTEKFPAILLNWFHIHISTERMCCCVTGWSLTEALLNMHARVSVEFECTKKNSNRTPIRKQTLYLKIWDQVMKLKGCFWLLFSWGCVV